MPTVLAAPKEANDEIKKWGVSQLNKEDKPGGVPCSEEPALSVARDEDKPNGVPCCEGPALSLACDEKKGWVLVILECIVLAKIWNESSFTRLSPTFSPASTCWDSRSPRRCLLPIYCTCACEEPRDILSCL
ncbi:hypothetical protein ACH5RR_037213 [Cinchona calisaya]|uniref:Uncharacterized protein n=1 Tax=Cinchona calisaya TaxID=153742 RepID=A0ABD2Y952_9GENT